MDDKYTLIYGIKGERLEIYKKISEKHGFAIRKLEDYELYLKVEDCLDGKINQRPSDFVMDFELEEDYEFVLLVNIHDDVLYDFIGDLKAEGVYIPHKAVLTPTNKKWTFKHLIIENKDEHKVMTLYGDLRRAMGVGMDIYKKTGDDKLLDALEKANDYFHPREFDFEELKTIYNNLATAINQNMAKLKS